MGPAFQAAGEPDSSRHALASYCGRKRGVSSRAWEWRMDAMGEGMNRYATERGTADEAVDALVRGRSPYPSMVPEDQSRLGDAAR